MAVGDVVGRGRDAVILDHGPGLVLRRSLTPRPLDAEAEVMAWVHAAGYPSPAVVGLSDGGLVMERVDGPTMLSDLYAHPDRAAAHMATLADLQHALHEIAPPPGLPSTYGAGETFLHADLHPDNVLLGPDGPVVIDWSNACVGPLGADGATVWLLLSCVGLPVEPPQRSVEVVARAGLVEAFLQRADVNGERDAARDALGVVLGQRRLDPHMAPDELAAMTELVHRQDAVRRAATARSGCPQDR